MREDVGAGAVAGQLDPVGLVQRVAEGALELIEGAEGVLVGSRGADVVTYVCGAGYLAASVGVQTSLQRSIGGLAILTNEVLRSDDTERDPRVDRAVTRRVGTRSTVCLPLCRGGEPFGVLAVGATEPNAFTDHDVEDLRAMAELISVSMSIADAVARLNDELARLAEAELRPGRIERLTSTSASRFVMNVLDPTAARLADARARVRTVLDDPRTLSVVFQPVLDLATDRIVAAEALARFDVDPVRSPDVWFAEAHATGLGLDLELLAAQRALDALPRFINEPMSITINVGPDAINDPALCDAICATGWPTRVILELTEHSAVDDYDDLADRIVDLRRSGVRLAVDDTGAGFASLAHILKLAPDYIKLDRELIAGIHEDPVRRALATALVRFAAETGAQTVAEGIETAEELEVVRELGVQYGQGWHIARPGCVDTVLRLMH